MRKYDDKELLDFIFEFMDEMSEHLSFTGDKNGFFTNKTVREACIRTLHKISETTQKLSDNLKKEISEVEWRKISAMRNVLVHEYLEGIIDNNIVFESITVNIPELKKILEKYYKQKFTN